MNIDLTTLVPSLTVFLAPFLPYLLKASEQAAEEAGKQLGVGAWEEAKALWSKLRPKVEAKPAAQAAVREVAAAPTDEDALAALRLQLKKVLAEEPALTNELASLLGEARTTNVTAIASGARSFSGVSIHGSTIILGDHNKTGE